MTAQAESLKSGPAAVPGYLADTYWWAYVHPGAVRVFERQWLVNLILWGNFARLRDSALDALGEALDGKTLQVACVYGDLTQRLAERIAPGGALDVVDVLPVQLTRDAGASYGVREGHVRPTAQGLAAPVTQLLDHRLGRHFLRAGIG